MRKKARVLAVLLTLVLLLTGCQSIAEGVMSGATGLLANRLDNMEPQPVWLDQRLQYGMSAQEVKAVLGEPQSSRDMSDNEELSMPVVLMDYDWAFGGKSATLQLMFIGDNLSETELTIPCEAQERAQLVEETKTLVKATYGEMTGYRWSNMTTDAASEIGYIAQFEAYWGTSGLQGEIMAVGEVISISCVAA